MEATAVLPARGGTNTRLRDDTVIVHLEQPSPALALAAAEEEVPANPVVPAWLGDEGERELASGRLALHDEKLLAQYDLLWGHYEQRRARLSSYSHRVRVLERAIELFTTSFPGESCSELHVELSRNIYYRDSREEGPWDCVTSLMKVVETQRRRDVYAMAAKRWTSRRRDAEAKLAEADTPVPEVLASIVLVGGYLAGRGILHAGGVDGTLVSGASLAAMAFALVLAAIVYFRGHRSRVASIRLARRALNITKRYEQLCEAAAAGGDDPPEDAFDEHELEMLHRASSLSTLRRPGA